MSFFRKYFLMLILTGLVSLSFLFLNHFINIEGRYQQLVEDGYMTLSQEIGSEIHRIVSNGFINIQILAENPMIRDPDSTEEELVRELEKTQKFHHIFKDVSYVDTSGYILGSVKYSFRGSWKETFWFKECLEGRNVLSEVHAVLYPYDIVMTASTPVYDYTGNLMGVLIGQFDLDRIRDISRRSTMANYLHILIVDGNGALVEGPVEEDLLRLAEPEILRKPLENGMPGIIHFDKGNEKLVAVSSSIDPFYEFGDHNWTLSLIFDEDVFYGTNRSSRFMLFISVLISISLIILISFVSSKKIQKRLVGIGTAIEEMANENDSPDIIDSKGDELTKLVNIFNKSRKHLYLAREERRVAHATLKEINKDLTESNQRFTLAVNGANDSIWDWNILSDELYFSSRWNSMAGREDDKKILTIQNWYEAIYDEDLERVQDILNQHLRGESALFSTEYRIRNENTGIRWILSRGLAVRNDEGVAVRMAGSHTDITSTKHLQDEMRFNAFHDTLTQLPNRNKLRERIEESLMRSDRSQDYSFSILYLDFDGFKHVNDTFGHITGDHLLIAIADRLKKSVRPLDLVSRVGGDEFVILLDGIRGDDYAGSILNRIMSDVEQPYHIDGHPLYLTVSIGIANLDDEGQNSADDIIQRADIAMYKAKNNGKAQFQYYEPSMGSHEKRRWFLENELHKALGTPHLHIHYQPVVSGSDHRIYGFEALLRWNHEEQGYISPSEFIPVAEETGFITQITTWILFQVCQQAVRINRDLDDGQFIRLAVNVSSRDFQGASGLDVMLRDTLKSTGCRTEWIAIEVTERTLIKDFEIVSKQLGIIDEMGVVVELDDFGTGYSSLSYLNRFPLKILKVDMSFVKTMLESESSLKLVQTIIHMAKDLDLKVIAEGVENQEQLAILKSMDCDYYQGYLFSKPLPVESIPGYLNFQKQ